MEIKDIPLIIPNFNQLTFLRNLINQFKFFYPENPIAIVDNGSTYKPLLDYYHTLKCRDDFWLLPYEKNDFIGNLNNYLNEIINWEYAVISDPDISIPFTTYPKFLELFKHIIDSGYHHAGFGLRTDNIPGWNKKAAWIKGDEEALKRAPITIGLDGQTFTGFKAPIDTTFCMFKRDNGGFSAPMPPKHWDSSVRILEAEHLTWYLHPDYLNEEMQNYFKTCLFRDDTKPSAGRNHFRPE